MRHIATAFIALGVLLFGTAEVLAQTCDTMEEVTINQITAVPQANIDQLNALGANATAEQIHLLLTNEFDNARRITGAPFRCVKVTAVVLSDPRYSGLASWVTDLNRPGRIHVYIRDTAAETQGPEGMTIQVVDPHGAVLPLRVGDTIELEGRLEIFGAPPERAWQLTPLDANSIDVLDPVDPGAAWLAPIQVTTNDINMVVGTVEGEPVVQANWSRWNDLNSAYVRIAGALMTNSTQADRPNWAFSSVGQESRVGSRDVSLRYRNDRHSTYPPPPAFFTRPQDEPFVVPPPGAVIDVQGFLAFGAFDAFSIGQPLRAFHFLAPITDEDLDITSSPPITSPEPPSEVPTGDFEVFATIVPSGDATLASAVVNYEFVPAESAARDSHTGTVSMQPAEGEHRYSAIIPASEAGDGSFVRFTIAATDSEGATFTTAPQVTRVLFDGVTSIEEIQRTIDGSPGPSPFAGITTDLNIQAVVMTDPSVTANVISIQDDAGLAPWTGVFLTPTEALVAGLSKGDRVTITRGTIREHFGETRLDPAADGWVVTSDGVPYDYVTLATGALAQDADLAESYEGMALRFENVIITAGNADAPSNFGEWAFASDIGDHANLATNQLRGRSGVSQSSTALANGTTLFNTWDRAAYIQGILSWSFGNYKLLPEDASDIGDLTTSGEPSGTAQAISLDGAYPNPVASNAAISYTLAQSGHVRLEVFDVTGRRVAMLVDSEQAAGAQEARFDATAVASGLYIIRLTADSEVLTTRVVVTR
jgi:hypothetical protein